MPKSEAWTAQPDGSQQWGTYRVKRDPRTQLWQIGIRTAKGRWKIVKADAAREYGYVSAGAAKCAARKHHKTQGATDGNRPTGLH